MNDLLIAIGLWGAGGCVAAPELLSMTRKEWQTWLVFVICGPFVWLLTAGVALYDFVEDRRREREH